MAEWAPSELSEFDDEIELHETFNSKPETNTTSLSVPQLEEPKNTKSFENEPLPPMPKTFDELASKVENMTMLISGDPYLCTKDTIEEVDDPEIIMNGNIPIFLGKKYFKAVPIPFGPVLSREMSSADSVATKPAKSRFTAVIEEYVPVQQPMEVMYPKNLKFKNGKGKKGKGKFKPAPELWTEPNTVFKLKGESSNSCSFREKVVTKSSY